MWVHYPGSTPETLENIIGSILFLQKRFGAGPEESRFNLAVSRVV